MGKTKHAKDMNLRRSTLGLAGLLLALALLAGSCVPWNPLSGAGIGDLKIYWLTNTRVYRANLDGTAMEMILEQTSGPPTFRGLAIDPINQEMYWADTTGAVTYKANLDGSGFEVFRNASATTMAVDPYAEKLYYGHGMEIRRVNLDGTGDEEIWSGSTISDFKLDLINDYIYWCDGGTIYRSAISGALSPSEVLVTGNTVMRLDVDVSAGMIYYLDTVAFEVRKVPVTGGGFTSVASAPTGFGLAVDPFEGKVYWSEETGATRMRIVRADTSGGGVEAVVDVASASSNAGRIALFLWP